ncbi:MAG: hypothetical protein WCH99_19045 [Verrucomicrobiota bacterium]
MKQLFSLYRRNGIYYAQNTQTGKQESLRTRDEAAAKALLHSKNEASRQPILNRQIALAYLSATDAEAAMPLHPEILPFDGPCGPHFSSDPASRRFQRVSTASKTASKTRL